MVDAVFGMAIEGKFWQVDADADPEKQQIVVLEYRIDESGGISRLKAHQMIKHNKSTFMLVSICHLRVS